MKLHFHRHILRRSRSLHHSVLARACGGGWITHGHAFGRRGECCECGGSSCREKSSGWLDASTSVWSRSRGYSHAVKHSFSSLTQHIPEKKRLVFLGTPDVSAQSLQMLATACSNKNVSDNHADRNETSVNYEIVAVVTQPPAPSGRNLKLLASPVQLLAEKLRIPCLTPPSAKDPTFLQVSLLLWCW